MSTIHDRGRIMRFPDFLIIGAQKSGTTSLYRDLLANPAVFFPTNKEVGDLAAEDVLTVQGRERYSAKYARALPEQTCGDATTDYAKLPDVPGVPERALEVLDHGFKVIYIVRDPIQRIVSHYHHELNRGMAPPPFEEAVREDRRYIDYSRYAMQLEPWVEAVGRDRVHVVQFEDYVEARLDVVAEVSAFIGVKPRTEKVKSDVVYNASQNSPVLRGFWKSLRNSPLYLDYVRPLLPVEARRHFRQLLLPRNRQSRIRPTEQTVEYLLAELLDDLSRHEAVLGKQYWTADSLRNEHVARGSAGQAG